MSGGMDGVEVGGAKSGVDGGVDSCVDGGALCFGASDHLGYESDFLGYGGAGLFGRSGSGESEEMGGVPFLCLHGVGIFGQRADGVGGAVVGSYELGPGRRGVVKGDWFCRGRVELCSPLPWR